MATHRESRAIARPPEEIFDIVADVERYPELGDRNRGQTLRFPLI